MKPAPQVTKELKRVRKAVTQGKSGTDAHTRRRAGLKTITEFRKHTIVL